MNRFVPYIVESGRMDVRGAPETSFGRTNERKYENGLNERAHQTIERKANALLHDAGIGSACYFYAYNHAAELGNLTTTTVPVPGTRETRRSSPYLEVYGSAYREETRALPVFGALAFPRQTGEAKHRHPRRMGLFLGNKPLPSRDYYVSLESEGQWSVRTCGPETTFSGKLSVVDGPRSIARHLESRYAVPGPPGEHSLGLTNPDLANDGPSGGAEDEYIDDDDEGVAPAATPTVTPAVDDVPAPVNPGAETLEVNAIEPQREDSVVADNESRVDRDSSTDWDSFVTATSELNTSVSASEESDEDSSLLRALGAIRGGTLSPDLPDARRP